MRTDVAQPIRLADYRAPDYLIDRVDLDIRRGQGMTVNGRPRPSTTIIPITPRTRTPSAM